MAVGFRCSTIRATHLHLPTDVLCQKKWMVGFGSFLFIQVSRNYTHRIHVWYWYISAYIYSKKTYMDPMEYVIPNAQWGWCISPTLNPENIQFGRNIDQTLNIIDICKPHTPRTQYGFFGSCDQGR